MRFAGKRVVVTGAAAGIGRAVAVAFASEGAEVMAADRDRAGLEALAAQYGMTALPYDAMVAGEGAAMIAKAGTFDILVNVAGIYARNHFTQVPDAEWDRVIRINLTSVFEICRAAIGQMRLKGGAIINTTSTSALGGLAYAGPYAASKAGVIALTKSLAAEYGSAGLRVNAVAPGRVLTGIGAHLPPLEGGDLSLTRHLPKLAGMEEGAAPEDIAGAYLWLASSDARFVSGEVHVVDGGHAAG